MYLINQNSRLAIFQRLLYSILVYLILKSSWILKDRNYVGFDYRAIEILIRNFTVTSDTAASAPTNLLSIVKINLFLRLLP
jgi:hypothetical protein